MVYPLLVSLFAASGLAVVARSPAVDCPSPTDVADAVGRRMPVSAGGGDGWSIFYGWEGSSPGRAVSFSLVAPGGAPLLERRFPLLDHECLAAAATMAVIVERYFRDLAWTTGAPLPPVRVASGEPRSETPLIAKSAVESLRLSVGAALQLGGVAGAAATVGARAHVLGPLHLGLTIFVPPRHASQTLGSGTLAQAGRVQADDWQARVSGWAVGGGAPVEWGGGLEVLVGLQAASSAGISSPTQGARALLALGLGGGPCYHLGRRWRVALELGVSRTLPSTTFYVTENGVDHDVLVPSPWTFLGTLTIGYALAN